MNKITAELKTHLKVFFTKVLDFIPNLLVMLIILAAGFITAYIVKAVLSRVFKAVKLDAWSDEVGLSSVLNKSGIKRPPAAFISLFVYWLTIITFFMAGFASLGLETTDTLASLFFLYLPKFISAILIFILGYIMAGFLGRAALLAGVNAGIQYARLLGDAVRLLVLIFVFAMALEQLAIAPKVVLAGFSIFFGSISLALAIAFGLGGRDSAKKFIEDVKKKKERDYTEPL